MKAKLWSWERFKKLAGKVEKSYEKKWISKEKSQKIAKATAAAIGIRKYGKEKMAKMAKKGKK